MTDLERFNFQELPFRVAMIDGEPWFVAVDVCNALDIDNATQALTRLDEDERTLISNEGRQVNAVNEAGLYSIILGSRKPEARAFKRWVTHEVLPTIRKTGSYQAPTGTNLLALAVIEAQQMLEASARQVAELTPRANAWDELAEAGTDYAVADAANILKRAGVDTGPQRLFESLHQIGWTYRGEKRRWRPYATALNAGYLTERAMPPYMDQNTGDLTPAAPQVRVTARGLERLRIRLGSLAVAS